MLFQVAEPISSLASATPRQLFPPNIARAVRARFRIIDSKDMRGTSMSLRISALRSRRWALLGRWAAARSKAPKMRRACQRWRDNSLADPALSGSQSLERPAPHGSLQVVTPRFPIHPGTGIAVTVCLERVYLGGELLDDVAQFCVRASAGRFRFRFRFDFCFRTYIRFRLRLCIRLFRGTFRGGSLIPCRLLFGHESPVVVAHSRNSRQPDGSRQIPRVGAAIQQDFRPRRGSSHRWTESSLAMCAFFGIYRGPMIEQDSHRIRIAGSGCEHERRSAMLIGTRRSRILH